MAILPVLSFLYAVFALSMATEVLNDDNPDDSEANVQLSDSSELKSVEKRAVCQRGWSPCGGRYFKFFSTRKTWNEAERFCVRKGGHLASLLNSNDANWIKSLIRNSQHTWIGGGRSGSAPGWYWTDGSPLVFTNWANNQPDFSKGNEQCMELFGNGQWNDHKCFNRQPFVCVKI